jgi:hypothetical protein
MKPANRSEAITTRIVPAPTNSVAAPGSSIPGTKHLLAKALGPNWLGRAGLGWGGHRGGSISGQSGDTGTHGPNRVASSH